MASLATCCPTCGHPVSAQFTAPSEIVAAARLTGNERRIVERLVRSFGKFVSTEALVQAAFGDRIDGGPLLAKENITVHVHRSRQKLKRHGLTIEGRGGGRRLIWLATKGAHLDSRAPAVET